MWSINVVLFLISSPHRSQRSGCPAGHAPAAAQCAGVLAVRRLTALQKPTLRPQEEGGGEGDVADELQLLIYEVIFKLY